MVSISSGAKAENKKIKHEKSNPSMVASTAITSQADTKVGLFNVVRKTSMMSGFSSRATREK